MWACLPPGLLAAWVPLTTCSSGLRVYVFSVCLHTAVHEARERWTVTCPDVCSKWESRAHCPSFGLLLLTFKKFSLCLKDFILSRRVHLLSDNVSQLLIPDMHARRAGLVRVVVAGFPLSPSLQGSHSLPRPAREHPLEPAHLVAPGAVAGVGMPDWEAKAGLVLRGTGLWAGPWLCSICEVLERPAQSSLPGQPFCH